MRLRAGDDNVRRASTTAALTAKFAPTRYAPLKTPEKPWSVCRPVAPAWCAPCNPTRFAAGNEDVPGASTTAALTSKFAPTRCARLPMGQRSSGDALQGQVPSYSQGCCCQSSQACCQSKAHSDDAAGDRHYAATLCPGVHKTIFLCTCNCQKGRGVVCVCCGRDFEREIAGMLEAAGAHNDAAVQEAEQALALKVAWRTPLTAVHAGSARG